VGDGSSADDARDTVEIDLTDPVDRWRYKCPNGHRSWEPTGRQIWCRQCARNAKTGYNTDPSHAELIDEKTGETIPWSAVRLA